MCARDGEERMADAAKEPLRGAHHEQGMSVFRTVQHQVEYHEACGAAPGADQVARQVLEFLLGNERST